MGSYDIPINAIPIIFTGNRSSDIVYYLRYSGEPGNIGPDYNMTNVMESPAGSHLSKINCLVSKEDCLDTFATYDLFYSIRSQAKIDNKCSERISNPNPNNNYECFDNYCLFDIQQDPCEYQNIAKQNQQALNLTILVLEQYKKSMIKQNIVDIDPNADPSHYDGYWDTWMERSTSDSSKQHTCIIIIMSFLYFLTN